MDVLEIIPTEVFSGSLIAPSELLELAEFATPRHELSDEQRAYEAENLAEWCDGDPKLAQHAVLLARGKGCRREVIDGARGGRAPGPAAVEDRPLCLRRA